MQTPWSFTSNTFQFQLQTFSQFDKDQVDFSTLQSSLQPPGVSSAAWSAIYPGLAAQFGGTWGGYIKMLHDEAAYRGRRGKHVNDVSQLWQLAITQQDGLSPVTVLDNPTDLSVPSAGLPLGFTREFTNSVSARSLAGPMGLGWRDNWQYSLSTATDGT